MKLVVLLLSLVSVGAQARGWKYQGQFENIVVDDPLCEGLIEPLETNVELFFTSRYTTLMRFRQDGVGLFAGQSIVGRYGYKSDVYSEKTLDRGAHALEIILDGYASRSFLLLDVTVSYVDAASGDLVCVAKGEFSGFH